MNGSTRSQAKRWLFILGVLALLLGSVVGGVAGPVVAQSNGTDAGNATGNGSGSSGGWPGANGTDGVPNESVVNPEMNGSNVTGSGSGGGRWFNIPIPGMQSFMDATLGPVLNFMYGTPRLCIGLLDGEPGWTLPQCWPYNQMLGFYLLSVVITVPVLVALTFWNAGKYAWSWVPGANPYSAAKQAIRGLAAVMIAVPFYLPLVATAHAISDALAKAIAPDPGAVVSNAGAMFKFSIGAAVVAGSALELGKEFVKWLLIIQLIEWLYLLVFPMLLMPLIAARVYDPDSLIASAGSVFVFIWLGVLIANPVSAVFLSMFWFLDWGAHLSGVLNVFLSNVFLFISIITDPLIVLGLVWNRQRVMGKASALMTGGVATGVAMSGMARAKERGRAAADHVSETARERGRAAATRARSRAGSVADRARSAVARGGSGSESVSGETSADGGRSDGASRTRADGDGRGRSGGDDGGSRSNAAAAKLRQLEEADAKSDSPTSVSKRRRVAHLRAQLGETNGGQTADD